MNCFACGKPCGYPICNGCTREGFDINKILSGKQKPKEDKIVETKNSTLDWDSNMR